MTQDQYVEAMLKIAYAAGCEVARQDAEKEAADLPRPKIPAKAQQYQSPTRGEHPNVARTLERNAPAPPTRPVSRTTVPGPKMVMQGRTPGLAVRNRQQRQTGSSVATR